ncbi:hypothetical protein [Paraburkholderia sp. BL10I2N1]|uniref:hypothetical protein n=1 Tax=Paraburkholderia sp. BL10I2N1 TaxID=1938796 RepID=UPI00105B77F8|nr:hypothetical protein [Paraburkholderia sp. BL10I2N1]TDN63154.1 hypothetical protein B0G77_6781 [Paraburkholderia sp. BL10I2N1]
MADKTFDQLPASEQEDFRNCLDADLAPEMFKVTFREELVGDGEIKFIERAITVQFGVVSREYDGGNGTHRTVDFEDDVKMHVFA